MNKSVLGYVLAVVAMLSAHATVVAHNAPQSQSLATGDSAAETVGTHRLFAIILRPGPAWKAGKPFEDQGLSAHFRYWKALFDRGVVVAAGPLGTDSGLVLFYAGDQNQAEHILRDDPAIVARIFVGQVSPYAPPMISAEPPSITKP